MTNFQPQLPPAELAAMIDREGLAFEYKSQIDIIASLPRAWFLGSNFPALQWVQDGYEIRLAPGALTEFGLKPPLLPHNPDNLPADKITEGGKYRAWSEGEYKCATSSFKGHLQKLIAGEWTQGACGDSASGTYRVLVDAPYQTSFPTTTPTTEPESETPKDEPWRAKLREELEQAHEGWGDAADLAREPMPRLEAVKAKSFKDDNGEYLAEDLHNLAYDLETELRATQRKLDEANGLLERAKITFESITGEAGFEGLPDSKQEAIYSTIEAITQHQAL